jgi:hypothetical protein
MSTATSGYDEAIHTVFVLTRCSQDEVEGGVVVAQELLIFLESRQLTAKR